MKRTWILLTLVVLVGVGSSACSSKAAKKVYDEWAENLDFFVEDPSPYQPSSSSDDDDSGGSSPSGDDDDDAVPPEPEPGPQSVIDRLDFSVTMVKDGSDFGEIVSGFIDFTYDENGMLKQLEQTFDSIDVGNPTQKRFEYTAQLFTYEGGVLKEQNDYVFKTEYPSVDPAPTVPALDTFDDEYKKQREYVYDAQGVLKEIVLTSGDKTKELYTVHEAEDGSRWVEIRKSSFEDNQWSDPSEKYTRIDLDANGFPASEMKCEASGCRANSKKTFQIVDHVLRKYVRTDPMLMYAIVTDAANQVISGELLDDELGLFSITPTRDEQGRIVEEVIINDDYEPGNSIITKITEVHQVTWLEFDHPVISPLKNILLTRSISGKPMTTLLYMDQPEFLFRKW